eukprot:CAMPEP_0201610132 /NCGR_PEP_ID=MMETSP0492-20130828/15875_1 /ASSEMBLY_ACC=CAM_ASM_000837 /TAXON_ID=420259 /ORGANISM="Thalassiosira gravida, Strain GMp14c1" /LENGTH=438 /DNA_ID=CAMNT_0048075831 /DNA_START=55 /DNA_END=1371 /DNA_ORIENTATION=-
MASRIAVRLPLHLQRATPCLRNASAVATRPSLIPASSQTPNLPKRRISSKMSYNNRSTFTSAMQDHIRSSLYQPQSSEFHTSHQAPFQTHNNSDHSFETSGEERQPGSIAFGECEISALSDLFLQFAKTKDSVNDGQPYLTPKRIKLLLESVGEKPDEQTLQSLMSDINAHKDGRLRLDCFLRAADRILGEAPARIVLVVGGPGSGKGALCKRLAKDCGAVHLSCGEMLREEVEAQTPLGREVAEIMARGDLVSSALVTALMRRRMRLHPGRRILLDGFPRSLENARDFVELCGPPELALHLDCDDTVLIERILARGGKSAKDAERAASEGEQVNVRSDDNVHTAIQRLKNYHKHHPTTMSWLKEIRVPIVELDCSGSKDDVWQQLMAIGRLMRPAVKLPQQTSVQGSQQQHREGNMALNGNAAVSQNAVNEDIQWMA